MGNRIVAEEEKSKWIMQQLLEFDRESKSSPGIHSFHFNRTPLKDGSDAQTVADGDPDEVVITSEVTDENNVLDVIYKEWQKTPLGVWEPIFIYPNGRMVQAAVYSMLSRNYERGTGAPPQTP
jgi:hypothetical protein